jgi:hypothetical protein
LNRMEPPTMWAGGEGRRRRMASELTVLPQPDSPTNPTILPAHVEGHAVDHADPAGIGLELDAQVADLEERGGLAAAPSPSVG